MLSDSYDKLNEYDKIIFDLKNINNNFRFLIVEDLENKCWFVYDSQTGRYVKNAFGSYVTAVFNQYTNYSLNATHHKNLIFNVDTINETQAELQYQQINTALQKLRELFVTIPHLKKKQDSNNFKALLLGYWKLYRYAPCGRLWTDYIEMTTETLEDCKQSLEKIDCFSKSDAKELYESNKSDAQEHFKNLHKVITKNFLVYYDEIAFIDNKNVQHFGRAFVTDNDLYIFAWDLYHVLVSGITPTPHICPHCNQIFFSNNNKIIYCEDCQAEKNVIRNQKRKQSVRYIHKKIYDKLNNSKKYTNETRDNFLNESNYYWDCVLKRDIVKNPLFTEKIETEQQYKEWLENKLNSY